MSRSDSAVHYCPCADAFYVMCELCQLCYCVMGVRHTVHFCGESVNIGGQLSSWQ